MRPEAFPRLAALRRELGRVTQGDPRGHENALDSLHPHSVVLVERGDGAKRYHAYNCLMHALDLRELPKELMDMEERVNQLDIGSPFLSDLLASGVLERIPDAKAGEESVAIYFNGDAPEHAGLVTTDGLITSKWGLGNLYRHPSMSYPRGTLPDRRLLQWLRFRGRVSVWTVHQSFDVGA